MQGHEVLVGMSGVGKVMAAMTAQALIERFNPDLMLFTGLAGALLPSLERGDVVLSTDCVQHDLFGQGLGFRRGEIPYTGLFNIKADEELLQHGLRTKLHSGSISAGRVLSGDQFIKDAHRHEFSYLTEELKGVVVEMAVAAVATVCHFNKKPFLIIRTVSDRADGSASEHFVEFLPHAADNSFRVVDQILRGLVR